jgi:hypothetical protein
MLAMHYIQRLIILRELKFMELFIPIRNLKHTVFATGDRHVQRRPIAIAYEQFPMSQLDDE